MISSPWDEKEDLDGLVVPASRHESLRHVGHEVWIRGSGSTPKFHGSAQKERGKNMIFSPWDEKEDLDGLVVPASRHESLRHVGHEVAHVIARLSQLTPPQLHVNSLVNKQP